MGEKIQLIFIFCKFLISFIFLVPSKYFYQATPWNGPNKNTKQGDAASQVNQVFKYRFEKKLKPLTLTIGLATFRTKKGWSMKVATRREPLSNVVYGRIETSGDLLNRNHFNSIYESSAFYDFGQVTKAS